MGQAHVRITRQIAAPIESVFERISDHEDMSNWPGLGDCRLVKPGEPRNGLGAVRRLKARGLTIDEEVILWEPPHRYDYTIIRGLPVEHRGTVTLEEKDGGTEVAWEVHMSSRIPLLAQIVIGMLRRGLPAALEHVARRAERNPG